MSACCYIGFCHKCQPSPSERRSTCELAEPVVIPGVRWTVEGERRDLSVAWYARAGHADFAAVLVGPTTATSQRGDGGHPVMTIEQARALAVAITEACDAAELELRGGA